MPKIAEFANDLEKQRQLELVRVLRGERKPQQPVQQQPEPTQQQPQQQPDDAPPDNDATTG